MLRRDKASLADILTIISISPSVSLSLAASRFQVIERFPPLAVAHLATHPNCLRPNPLAVSFPAVMR